ncbi:MAG: hypothetical protein NC231_04885 [Bacillus sp. (in: Bacteria)]|nr:hypothetical protein [Bacillus sp. (in: firmicutes)]MCM1428017.1 hypothetical protein [Eubacterium sp.]
MRLTENAKTLLIDLLLLCVAIYFLASYIEYWNRQDDYRITPLDEVSRDIWYDNNYIYTLTHPLLLQLQYEASASLQADIADAAGMETIEIYRKNSPENLAYGIVLIKDASGNILTVLSSNSRDDNRNSIYLYEKEGTAMLMTFRINDFFEWTCDYQYEIFRLDENNEPVLITGSECFFTAIYDDDSDSRSFPLAWITQLEDYFADAVLLLSTEENTFRSYSIEDESLSKWMPVLYQKY